MRIGWNEHKLQNHEIILFQHPLQAFKFHKSCQSHHIKVLRNMEK